MTPLQVAKAECPNSDSESNCAGIGTAGIQPKMTPLQEFAQAVKEARKAFDADRDMAAWLVFYEAKQTAYAKLVAVLPQVEAIEDFWRYVQNMAPAAWLPIIEGEILRITHSKHLCRDCGTVAVTWPKRRCARCQNARRLETYKKAKQRARVKQWMRKCPVCKVEPLKPRCRVCLFCQKASRRARNQRYQKSLKDGSVRRLEPRFTTEGMSTVTRNRLTRHTRQTVETEGVLAQSRRALRVGRRETLLQRKVKLSAGRYLVPTPQRNT